MGTIEMLDPFTFRSLQLVFPRKTSEPESNGELSRLACANLSSREK